LNKTDSTVPTVVRKNRPDVTNPDKVFGVRQSAAAAFETKAAAALPHSKCSVEIVTVLPVLRQIKDDFFSEPTGCTIVEAGRLPLATKSMRH
jgi:hypothetical protein